jgi:cyclase
MKKRRIIPVILYRKGYTVQGKKFMQYKNMGHIADTFTRFSQWGADELIVLDISGSENISNNKRLDVIHKGSADTDFLTALSSSSKKAFMPLAVGGGISNMIDIEDRLLAGADKIVINSVVFSNPTFLKQAAREFGSQCIVVSINFGSMRGGNEIYLSGEKRYINFKMDETLKMIEGNGAGEILLTDIDRDGMKTGYNISVLKEAATQVKIPVIACGGAGSWEDLYEVFTETKVDAAAAANIFFHSDQSIFLAHDYLFKKNLNVRSPSLIDRDW